MCEDRYDPYDDFPEDAYDYEDYDYEDDDLDEDDFRDGFPEEGDWEDEEESMFLNGG